MKNSIRKIYDKLPFRAPFYKLLRKIVSMPKKWQPYFYFSGAFSTKLDEHRFVMYNYGYQYHVENELFWGGIKNGWERESVQVWIELCKVHQHVFDIGANTGLFSVIAKTVNPGAHVTAFEPMVKIHDKLKKNIALNNYQLHTSLYALSNYNGTAKIYPTNMEHVYSVTVNKKRDDITQPVHEVVIDTIRLDKYIEENQVKQIDLIKIDVESHEPEVLEGMGIYLEKFKPTFLIEIQTEEIAKKIGELVKNCGYSFYNIDENTGIRKINSLEKSSYFNILMCSPQIARKIGLSEL